jgi:hypothetical protein
MDPTDASDAVLMDDEGIKRHIEALFLPVCHLEKIEIFRDKIQLYVRFFETVDINDCFRQCYELICSMKRAIGRRYWKLELVGLEAT